MYSRLLSERRKNTTFQTTEETSSSEKYCFTSEWKRPALTRTLPVTDPFCSTVMMAEREKRCEEILMIQAMGLKKRSGTYSLREAAVVGISGGLDSTLALLGDGESI